jgi:translation initiation factor IF-2-like protein
MMYYDYNKRSYLLPPGCKDLIDLLRLEEQKKQQSIQLPFLQSGNMSASSAEQIFAPWKLKKKTSKHPESGSLNPPLMREVTIAAEILVKELANIASQKPFRIIADLMEIGIFANVMQKVGFEAAARVLKKYGIVAKKAV